MSDVRDQLESLADSPPAPTGAQRDREIQQAVTRGLATPARDIARARWWWGAIGVGLAAAAAIAIWFGVRGEEMRGGNDNDGTVAAVHDAGERAIARDADQVALIDAGAIDVDDTVQLVVESGADAPVGELVEAREQTILRAGKTRVEAKTKTRFARETNDAKQWRLEQGQLAMEVAPDTTLEVRTPEARIVVVGSNFVVGRYASETVIDVQVGEVLVTPTDGEPVTVHAGESWPKPEVVADAGVAPPKSVDAGVRVPVLQFDATIIRKTIRDGKVGDAREMIEAQRLAMGSKSASKRALAELGILAAEADLAERKTKSAIGKYLDVVRDFSSTPQAEQALFAAAQLAIDRPDAGYKAEALLRDYLDTYPKGQFAKDAARLLESLKK